MFILTKKNGVDSEEILSDLRDFFENGKNQGRQEDELIKELGTPEDFCEILINENESEYSQEFKKDIVIKNTEGDFYNTRHNFNGDLEELSIETDSADIELIPSDTNGFEINGKDLDKKAELGFDDSGNKLSISLKRKKRSFVDMIFNFNNQNSWKINIFYKTERFAQINLKTVSGDLKLDKINSALFSLKTVSGDIIGNSINVDLFKFKSVSGDVKVKEIISKKIKFESVSGDIKSDNLESDDIRFKSVSGDIKINNVSNSFNGSSVSGDIIVYCNKLPEKISLKTVSGDIELKIDKRSDFEYDIKTLSGDIKSNIKFSGKKNRYSGNFGTDVNSKVILKTVSGDIKLNMEGINNEQSV